MRAAPHKLARPLSLRRTLQALLACSPRPSYCQHPLGHPHSPLTLRALVLGMLAKPWSLQWDNPETFVIFIRKVRILSAATTSCKKIAESRRGPCQELGVGGGGQEELVFHGYKVSILQRCGSSGAALHNRANILPTTKVHTSK